MSKKKKLKKDWIQYIVLAVIAITLYATGLHTEVIGFAQRGLLETGLLNPDLEKKGAELNSSSVSEGLQTEHNPEASFDLKLRDENGNIVSLNQFKGKVIFINFWATWCPPCVAEMPAINKLYQEMGDKIAFVMLSRDKSFEKAISFKQRKEYSLPIYTLASQLPPLYQSTALPTTFVIDADGKLALTHKGMADYNTEEFKSFLNSLE